jgi:DNA polymerase III epsilon subunit-like protein
MTYLFFDTETTGLPLNYRAPVTDLRNWPRLVQLAWIVTADDGRVLANRNTIIKPVGFIIPEAAAAIHGISNERALVAGADLCEVLEDFTLAGVGTKCDTMQLVAHNMAFDEKIVGAELLRCKMFNWLPEARRICTMQATTDFCQLPGLYGGYKWPKLAELHQKLFGEDFAEAHNAAADIQATARCFFELKRLKIISP